MITMSVDVEVMQYLAARGLSDSKLAIELKDFITFGYQNQLNYRGTAGWFSAFPNDSHGGSLWLTAYCLSVLSRSRPFATIDLQVLLEAATWIVAQQKPDGSFEPRGFLYHQELFGGLSGNFGLTAYVALALAEFNGQGFELALARSRAYLESHLSEAASGHSLAIGAYALARLGSAKAVEALDRLQSQGQADGEGGMLWNPAPAETTAYAVLALHEAARFSPASAGAAFLASRKNCHGGFGHSTQDTVMAFRAIVRDTLASQSGTQVSFRVLQGEALLASSIVDSGNLHVAQQFAIEPGADITVEATGSGPLSVQLAQTFNLPASALSSRGGLSLAVSYPRHRAAVGERLEARAVVRYRGERARTNMTLLEIGLPSGFSVDRAELQSLFASGGEIQRADVRGRTLIVYLDGIDRDAQVTVPFTLAAAYPAESAPNPSKAYDYYDPTIAALDGGSTLLVGDPGAELPFLRGDANLDHRVSLADAIRLLQALFAEPAELACADAADANDDGGIDIADPMAVLFFLYVSGLPPPPPFPQLGRDPTTDPLDCVLEPSTGAGG